MKWLKEENKKEARSRNLILENHQKNYEKCIKKIDNLIDLRASGEITEEEFLRNKPKLIKEKIRLEELLNDTGDRVNKWLEVAEKTFAFVEKAKERFKNGTLEEKREILAALGSNLILKDKKLSISIQKPLLLLEGVAKEVKAIHRRLEPLESVENKGKIDDIYSQSPILLRGQDSNLQPTG
ncbi:MAG TPA: hypothetical protein ENF31_00370 [bacterium]|nr:hypothetical protein [bacterium]